MQTIEDMILERGKTAPRITPDRINSEIAHEYYFTAAQAVDIHAVPPGPLDLLTFCVLVLRNGFTVTGESACASPENFDAEIGKRVARDNAVNKIWPLLGYELKSRIALLYAYPASAMHPEPPPVPHNPGDGPAPVPFV
jgi:hypothetical protein